MVIQSSCKLMCSDFLHACNPMKFLQNNVYGNTVYFQICQSGCPLHLNKTICTNLFKKKLCCIACVIMCL